MADKLGNIIALKRVEKVFLTAEKARETIIKREDALANLLGLCQSKQLELLTEQEALYKKIEKENESISLLNERSDQLTLDQLVLNKAEKIFLAKEAEQSKIINDLKKIKQWLCDDEDYFGLDDEFTGNNWYLPCDFVSFDQLSDVMDWHLTDSKEWLVLYDESEKYHKNINGSIQSFPFGLFQFYVSDLYKNSPRKRLLDAVKERLGSFNKMDSSKTNTMLESMNETVMMGKEALNVHEIRIHDINGALERIALKLVTQKIFQDKTQEERLTLANEREFSDVCLSFRFILPLYIEWVELSELTPKMLVNSLVSQAYQQIMDYQEQLKAFTLKLTISLKENNFYEKKISLNTDVFNTLIANSDNESFQQSSNLAEELISKHNTLIELYESLHDDYFSRLQTEVNAKKVQLDAKQMARKQEIDESKVNLHNYLGGEDTPGDLNNYLAQRNATYWWRDYFSSILAVFFHCPFGYVTEKEKRSQFINEELRPTLECYEVSRNNDDLSKLLCSSHVMFFKSRTRKDHSYCLTLDYMLDKMRKELLTEEQVATCAKNEEPLKQNNFLIGQF